MCDQTTNTTPKPCELCGGTTGRSHGKSYWRGLTLCCDCENGLLTGKFSAAGIASELTSMRRGTMLIDRPPLPKAIRRAVSGPPIAPRPEWHPYAHRKPWVYRDSTGRLLHQAETPQKAIKWAETNLAKLVGPLPSAHPVLTAPPVAAELPPEQPPAPIPAAAPPAPRLPRQARPRRKPAAVPVVPAGQSADPASPSNWRENARRIALAAHV